MSVKSLSFARVGPVHFQPIESELGPVASFISGETLNAGCGYRDISVILKGMGASGVVNVDIATDIPGAIESSLDAIPLESDRFDTVLCNAVLEHVEHIDAVMAELVRVLKPGGRLIVSIPFLQPYHASPTDFRRFTVEGIRQLGEAHGLQVVQIRGVHSIAQTLGWILWEHLVETRARVTGALLYPVIWLATRFSHVGNPNALRGANTFQAVYQKPLAPL